MTTVIMRTTEGDIKINLFDDKTPETVANFLGLATGEKNGPTRSPVSRATNRSTMV